MDLKHSAAFLAALLALPVAAHAGFLGQTYDASYRFPDAGTVYGSGTPSPASFTVTGGLGTTIDVEGVTDIAFSFTDTVISIAFSTVLNGPTWNNVSFNGVRLKATAPHGITGASVSAGWTGFDNSRVSFTADEIFFNWSGLSYVDGTAVRVTFDFAKVPVPEPAGLALLAFAAAAAGLRRRRA
ncbi:MAG: PEP-CTERM sorting domain-containing protein [Chromatiales bacterium]|jgi:hypothetical protein|nr:PEP-CTERM sorting domain-containing protein [Chromatiales bacterium]